ncbi:hypothetical protein BC827DRAFT_1185211 [Russula dissimulans]|nr:hypothetical protein BC827DRAFT_1185211 [Russula dissimulans]
MHDIILNRVLHELLMMQWEHQLHHVVQFSLVLGFAHQRRNRRPRSSRSSSSFCVINTRRGTLSMVSSCTTAADKSDCSLPCLRSCPGPLKVTSSTLPLSVTFDDLTAVMMERKSTRTSSAPISLLSCMIAIKKLLKTSASSAGMCSRDCSIVPVFERRIYASLNASFNWRQGRVNLRALAKCLSTISLCTSRRVSA